MLKRAGAFTAPEKTHEPGWEPIHFIAHFGASTAIPPPPKEFVRLSAPKDLWPTSIQKFHPAVPDLTCPWKMLGMADE
jgi:hypothetical protein